MADQVDSTSTASVVPNFHPSLIRRFLELIRFSHTVFALPFAALACVFAIYVPAASLSASSTVVSNGVWPLPVSQLVLRLFGVLLCMVTARSAAMAFNRLVDTRIDAANPRTATRHLPAGLLSAGQVWGFFAVAALSFFAACLLFLPNWLPLAFSIPVFVWICGYSLAKRFTSAAHVWLGIALALSPVCAWVAIRGELLLVSPADVLPACGLALAIVLWVSGFDIIYACQDAEFDQRAGLQSIPARLGIAGALRVAAILHYGMLAMLALLPILFPALSLGWVFYAALFVVALLIVWQHSIVRPDDLRRVGVAFFNINALISLGLCLVTAIDTMLR